MKDPKDLLCEFNERGNISPITRNSRFKEKEKTNSPGEMDKVMKVISRKQRETEKAGQQDSSRSKDANMQLITSETETITERSDHTWEKTLSSKKMLNFDTMNLDDSIFENDQDSEVESGKEEQTQVEPIKRTLHNGPPTSSFDREIQIHHEQQDDSSTQNAPENYTTSENKLINKNQMMEMLAGALSNILEEERRDPRDRQREVTANINSTIEELDDLQEEISILPYEEVGETRLNDLMSTAKELSERLKKLKPQATTLETRNLMNAIKIANYCQKTIADKRDQTIQNRVISTENRKKRTLDVEKLELPKLESALDYRLWHKTINIKYENTISIPAKQLFVQKLKKSIAVEAVYSYIQHITSAKAIVTTLAREIGSLQQLNKDAEAKMKDFK